MTDREFDLVLFGATGFVGRLTATHLAAEAPATLRVALAGRDLRRLEAVKSGLRGADTWSLLVVDSADEAAVASLAQRSRVVATTVGPYSRYGLPLVTACARSGTHYADLTGEVVFMRRVADTLDAEARSTGARIVHACGFDSIPSDLGVLEAHDAVRADGEGELEDTTLAVTAIRGGVSGGTVASALQQFDDLAADPSARRLVADPYALSPARDREPDRSEPDWPRETDLRGVVRDRALGMWLAPFVMAPTNSRVVRRSNALQDWAYGRRLRYREVMGFPDGPAGLAKASALTAGLAAAVGVLTPAPSRSLLARVLPKPGDGPSPSTQERGMFRVEVHARTSSGARYVATVAAAGDPGYAATAVMFGQSALALACDTDRLPDAAGALTPATGLGRVLADRLRAQSFTLTAGRVG
jgi:short subunit dehydrogenase-like uncharacterized protein